MAKVYVVMGNDFPAAVFSTEALAQAYCERRKADETRLGLSKIYWRSYEFEIDKEKK